MRLHLRRKILAPLFLSLVVVVADAPARAEDIFTWSFTQAQDPRFTQSSVSSYASADTGDMFARPRLPRVYISRSRHHIHPLASGSTTYCVRACDGRYFPLAAKGDASPVEVCRNFCPAATTEIYKGASIDDASNDSGKAYSKLPNAFRYRNELVVGCSCNGKTASGLAPVKIDDDPTLRKGDIVVGEDGMKVVGSRDRHTASLNLSPLPRETDGPHDAKPATAQSRSDRGTQGSEQR